MTVYHHKGDIASTAFSPQNAFFSHQAKDWGTLGSIAAAGNGIILFTDNNATNSPRYYRFAVH
jgi:hypothetical protein